MGHLLLMAEILQYSQPLFFSKILSPYSVRVHRSTADASRSTFFHIAGRKVSYSCSSTRYTHSRSEGAHKLPTANSSMKMGLTQNTLFTSIRKKMSGCVVINIFEAKHHNYSSWSTGRERLRSEETHNIPSEIYAEQSNSTVASLQQVRRYISCRSRWCSVNQNTSFISTDFFFRIYSQQSSWSSGNEYLRSEETHK